MHDDQQPREYKCYMIELHKNASAGQPRYFSRIDRESHDEQNTAQSITVSIVAGGPLL